MGSGVDSEGSRTGAGSRVDSEGYQTGTGPGVDNECFQTGVGSGVDSEGSRTGPGSMTTGLGITGVFAAFLLELCFPDRYVLADSALSRTSVMAQTDLT